MDENHTEPVAEKTTNQTIPGIRPRKTKYRANKPGKFLTDEGSAVALSLLVQGTPVGVVANHMGVTSSAMAQFKQRYARVFEAEPFAQDYQVIKQRLLSGAEAVALESIVRCAENNDNLQRAAYAFKVLHEAGRLERGLSTRNTEAHVHTTTQSFIEITPRKD